MRDLRRVCHLGYLNPDALGRPGRRARSSYEGNGLSISVSPNAWRQIAKLGGTESFVLEKESPRFADGLCEDTEREALAWAEAEGLLERAAAWRVPDFDENGEVCGWFTFFSPAEVEANVDGDEELEKAVEEIEGWRFTAKGSTYFDDDVPVPHSIAASYAVILWAEAHGFDGVWWEESYDPSALSAPRGVIFQGKIGDWKIRRGNLADEDFVDQ